MSGQQFAGANKAGASLCSPLEKRLAALVLPRIPVWLETYHLTLLTLVWCALIIVFSYLAAGNIRWLWLVSLMILLQYVTDHFDGKVGKDRNTGLVKWGFYMDHFLDYVFLSSLLIGYGMILPGTSHYYLLIALAIFGGFMVNSFLAFAATEKFRISHLGMGPTEFRAALIAINTLLILFGMNHMADALPYVLGCSLSALCIIVYRTQRAIWRSDMECKAEN